nr:MAG TPA_asm: Cytosine specific methyltransferase [Caudoviricetes sp.]
MVPTNTPLTREAAKKLMALDAQDKELLTYEKLDEWYTAWGGKCYVSFSGGKDSTDLAITHMVVRRLTPMECERLQGFPDHWTDIGEWTDEKGKKHKDADSPRYKALGNSIALPFWDWMLRRMARYLPEGATLGSLFDGIGGFPLCFERIHGKGTARWASEIEPFPIAVTKKHFPEEE